MYYTYARDYNGNRFLVPLLVGGLAGGALVSATRPRPVFVNPPQVVYPYPAPMPMPYYPY